MKKLEIRHDTLYTYSETVFPSTHYLYFYPHTRPYLRLDAFDIRVDPTPAGLAGRIDRENNLYYQLWFLQQTGHLSIGVSIQVSITPYNPYDFLLDPPLNMQQPVRYDHSPEGMLVPYLEIRDLSEQMKTFLRDFINKEYSTPLDFFSRLNQHISAEWDHQIRLEENVLTPTDCFEKKTGSCRDLAWMLINMLRYKGFASRFVSGYSFVPDSTEGHELHAWVEVLLPGAGWLAMDPTLGLLCTENYIPLAVSYDPVNTMPVQGIYMGSATSEMRARVVITEHQDQP